MYVNGIQYSSHGRSVSATYLSVWQEFHRKVDTVDFQHWKEPKLIVKILLHFFCHHPNDIDLLFQLLRALCERFIPDFQVRIRMI